tara:strand:- start:862 stop:1887 length:1026 start_codon:yes stop_codon:yes gene_type:complete
MSLDDFLGVYYIEDYHYWLALIAAIVITFYMGFDDEDDKNKYSIGERIFNFFGFSIFLSMFTWFGLFILAGILSLPISYIQKDLLNYETQNEINKKWVSAAKDLEDWCIGKKEIKRRSLTGDYIDQNVDNRLEVCLTQRDYRLSKVDKLIFDEYQLSLVHLGNQQKNFNSIPEKIKNFKSKVADPDIYTSESYFYMRSDDDNFYAYGEYGDLGNYVPQGNLAKDDFMGCFYYNKNERNCFKLNYVDDEELFYLHKYCGFVNDGCHMRIKYLNKNSMQYVTSYEIIKPRLRDYEEKKYIKEKYMSKLADVERKTKESISQLSSRYEQPEIILDIALSLDKLN